MTSIAKPELIDFHGQQLVVVNHKDQPYVAMRPVVEGMGLAWQTQHRKLSSDPRFCITEMVTQMPGDDQQRSVTCMPLRKLSGWLMTLHPNKVKPEIREKVITYQNECDDALWDYWTKGIAVRASFAVNPSDVLTSDEAETLRLLLKNAADRLPKEKQGAFMVKGWSKLKAHFKVGYRQIPRHEFSEAISIVTRHAVEGEVLPPEEAKPVQAYPHPCMQPEVLKHDLGMIQESMENVAAHLQKMLFNLQDNASAIKFRRQLLG